jgi:hypothetical protein
MASRPKPVKHPAVGGELGKATDETDIRAVFAKFGGAY